MGKMLEKIRKKIRADNKTTLETMLSSLRMEESTANSNAPIPVAEYITKATGRNNNKPDTGRNAVNTDTGRNTDHHRDPVTAT